MKSGRWIAICADTKLIVSWLLGARDTDAAVTFVSDLRSRLANRIQLTSDGYRPYLTAVDTVFGDDVDYAMLVKIYGADPQAETRDSPAKCIGAEKKPKIGDPDSKHISTSYAERSNLTMRMHMRRFTRLTNAFSKKVENHAAAMALHTMYYNFVGIHQRFALLPQWLPASLTSFGRCQISSRCWSSGKLRTPGRNINSW